MRFRNELGVMFDETDYNVAMALLLVGCHCFVANNERERGLYYITASQAMCRRMGYLNSDTHLRGLSFLTFLASGAKEPSVRSLWRFQANMVALNAQPYHYIPLPRGGPTLDSIVEPSEYPPPKLSRTSARKRFMPSSPRSLSTSLTGLLSSSSDANNDRVERKVPGPESTWTRPRPKPHRNLKSIKTLREN